jgi:hypothetical protein
LKPGNLQEFWKLLKKGKTREQPSNLIDTLFESFKKLSEQPDEDLINILVMEIWISSIFCVFSKVPFLEMTVVVKQSFLFSQFLFLGVLD